MLNRILALLFVALVLMISAEVLYLFFYKPPKDSGPAITRVSGNTPPTLFFRSLSVINLKSSDSLKSGIFVGEFSGKVKKVYLSSGIKDRFDYEKGVDLEATNGKINSFLFSKNNMPKVAIYSKGILGIQTKIKFDDLKSGDQITIVETFDLLREAPNLAKVVITKL